MNARRKHLTLAIAVALLAVGVFSSTRLEHGLQRPVAAMRAGAALEAPAFRAEYRSGRLHVAGTTVSARHEARLLQLIENRFGSAPALVELRAGVVVPDGWEAASLRMLQALAATRSGVAEMRRDRITLRGVTADRAALAEPLRQLQQDAPAGVEIVQDFIVVTASARLDELCRENLASASRVPVRFRRSSAEIRTASHATLDKVVDVANDCRHRQVAITGHTDALGDETWNRQLSLDRALAVADYLVRGGIDAGRLIIAGSGSSEPVADNATAGGRRLNRRIEFEFR